LDDWDSFPDGAGIPLSATKPRPALQRMQSPVQWVPRALSPSLGRKRPEREMGHLNLPIADI